MIYLEMKDEKSSKFWQVSYTEKCYTIVYGKIGTKGTVKVTTCEDPESEALKLVASKKKKGYVEAVEDLSPYLIFDTFNFKVAVLNSIDYDIEEQLEELSSEFYDEHYDFDMDEDEEEEYIQSEEYGRNYKAIEYIKSCKILKKSAIGLEKIDLIAGDDILEQIDLEWGGETEVFDINDLTDRELAQFPDLNEISVLCGYDGEADEIKEKCKKIGVNFHDPYQ
ncbi:MAG: WGR domain-containing protein [bacterium]